MPATSRESRLPTRLARALGVDRNPLRRTIDRAEAWIRAGLLVVFLVGAPVAAVAAGQATAQAVNPGTSAQPHAVQAVLLQPATAPAALVFLAGGGDVQVSARWKGADGSARTGEVFAPVGTSAGATVTAWLDASGQVVSPPQPSGPPILAVLAGAAALAAVGYGLRLALRQVNRILDWRRLAGWEAAWRATGPRWTGHRS